MLEKRKFTQIKIDPLGSTRTKFESESDRIRTDRTRSRIATPLVAGH